MVKHNPRPVIHMEKELGWPCKLGGAESLGICKSGPIVLARLMESQIWHQPASSVALYGEGSAKGQWPLLALIPDTSASPSMPLVPLKMLPWHWSSEGVSLTRESMCGFFKRNCLGSRSFFH